MSESLLQNISCDKLTPPTPIVQKSYFFSDLAYKRVIFYADAPYERKWDTRIQISGNNPPSPTPNLGDATNVCLDVVDAKVCSIRVFELF